MACENANIYFFQSGFRRPGLQQKPAFIHLFMYLLGHQLITEKTVRFNPVTGCLLERRIKATIKDLAINDLQYKNYVPVGGNLWKLKVELITP